MAATAVGVQFIDTRYPRYTSATDGALNHALQAKLVSSQAASMTSAFAVHNELLLDQQQKRQALEEELFDLSDLRHIAPAPTPLTSLRPSQTLPGGALGDYLTADSLSRDDVTSCGAPDDVFRHDANDGYRNGPLGSVQILGRKLEKVL